MKSVSDKIVFIESIFGIGNLDRIVKNIDVKCPICANKTNKKKLSIRLDDDRNHCWVCGWKAKNLVPLIKKYSNMEKLLEYREFINSKDYFEDEKIEKIKEKIKLPDNFQLIIENKNSKAFEYVKNRNLSEKDLWFFKLGISLYDDWKNYIIIPSFDKNGDINYFIGRNYVNKYPGRFRYKNPNYNKNDIIFNEINIDWSKRLVICEGVFDLFNCGDNAVPILGSDFNENSILFNSILLNNTPIALALDADMWNTKTLQIIKKLQEYSIEDLILVDTRPFGDPGSATKDQFKEALESAKPQNWESIFLHKLKFL